MTWVREIVDRVTPLATSRLVIDNRFEADLEQELWDGDELTESLFDAGSGWTRSACCRRRSRCEEMVAREGAARIKRIYGIGGLSYGNLSVRKDERRYWMSASGVDKSNLRVVGKDILMVKDYEAATGTMVLSVPPGVEPNRVSVDAIEHWMIYQEHPRRERDRARARLDPRHPRRPSSTTRAAPRSWRSRWPTSSATEPDPVARGGRAQEPRHHGHRQQPRGHLREDRAGDRGAGSDDRLSLNAIAAEAANAQLAEGCSARLD